MEKKNLLIVVLSLVALYVFFVIISSLLMINKKSVRLLKYKLKIGGIIITLTSMLNSCDLITGTKPEVSCYMPVLPNIISLDDVSYQNDYTLIITDMENNIVTGQIDHRASEATEFSFQVIDTFGNIVQSDNMTPVDGTFDTETEYISFEIDPSLTSGNYTLNLYDINHEEITANSMLLNSFSIYIDLIE